MFNLCRIIARLVLLTAVAGCSASTASRSTIGPSSMGIPPWYLRPPAPEGQYVAVATAEARDAEASRQTATIAGRRQLRQQLEANYEELAGKLRTELGAAGSDIVELFLTSSRAVSAELAASVPVKQVAIESTMNPRAYVLIELRVADVHRALLGKLATPSGMADRFRMTQTFKIISEQLAPTS